MSASQRRLFAPRLLFKITLPYVTLAIVLALAVTFVVARIEGLTVASQFSRQIDDARLRIFDSIVRAEQQQLDNVRGLARTKGLAQAVQAGDQRSVLDLVEPYAVNYNIERVAVIDANGRVLGGVQVQGTSVFTRTVNPAIVQSPAVQAVLDRVSDSQGDKYIALIKDGDDAVLYTVAPIYASATQVGVLLIGTTAQTLVERWRAANFVDVALYDATGAPLATSFGRDLLDSTFQRSPATRDATAHSPIAIDPGALTKLPLRRDLTLGSRDYIEIVGPLSLRGRMMPEYLGVALPKQPQANLLQQTQMFLWVIFVAGVVTAILLGITLSQRITRPITALVQAAEGITTGNLNHELPVTTGDEIGALTESFNTMVGGLRERERMYDILGRFVSPTIARLVLNRPLDLTGESKTLSILFTDLWDFTVLAEQEDPTVVINGLNAYFQIVVEAAERYGGVVNKFGGDSTLVLFGLTDDQENVRASAEAAVRAALDICAGLYDLNECRAEDGLPSLTAGIGINTGPVIAGLIGTAQRMEYTVIGDAVNLSARVQALSRELGSSVLMSRATYEALGCPPDLHVTDYGMRRIKGKRTDVHVYGVIGWEISNEA